jgi:hypothetical protein
MPDVMLSSVDVWIWLPSRPGRERGDGRQPWGGVLSVTQLESSYMVGQ